jgi:predicted DNA binding CopG/RHH family protein
VPKRKTDQEIDEEMGQAIAEGRELEGWEPVPARVSKTPRAVYGVRLSPGEYREISEAARAHGMSMSDFLRWAARAAIDGRTDVDQVAAITTAKEKARELGEALGRL